MDLGLLIKPSKNPIIKEAALLVGEGVKYQANGDFDKALSLISSGIDKLKFLISHSSQNKENEKNNENFYEKNNKYNFNEKLYKSNSKNNENANIYVSPEDRENALNFCSLFEVFKASLEAEKSNLDIDDGENNIINNIIRGPTYGKKENEYFRDVVRDYFKLNKNTVNSIDKLYDFTKKVILFFSKAFEKGFYWSQNLFIRNEILNQSNAIIKNIHLKHEIYKMVNEKISFLKNNISLENLEDFVDFLIDIQNICSKEFKFIFQCKFRKHSLTSTGNINSKNISEINKTNMLNKRINDIKAKQSNNGGNDKLLVYPDYYRLLHSMCINFTEFDNILKIDNFKNDNCSEELIKYKKKQICDIFYNSILKWLMTDIYELTNRFIKKPIMIFDN